MMHREQHNTNYHLSTFSYDGIQYAYDVLFLFFRALYKGVSEYSSNSNHTSSSSWITYTDGSVTQHLQNLPFGEPFIDQRATSYDIRYKFTGKEMDSETGYQYFGARYYDSDLSVWLSVDPLSDQYPSTSAYMYVLGNPIGLIDPNGMNAWEPPTEKGGAWTAVEGDSPGSLARDAGISQSKAEEVMRNYNKENGNNRSSDIMVYKGDKVSIPGSSQESSSSSPSSNGGATSSNSTSTPATSNNTGNNSSNSPSNLVMQEELGNLPTPYGDFSTTANSTLETNSNANYTVNVNADMDFQSITYHTGRYDYNISPNGVSAKTGFVSTGVNNSGQLVIGISTPKINDINYTYKVKINPQQAANILITVGSAILLKKVVAPIPVPRTVPIP